MKKYIFLLLMCTLLSLDVTAQVMTDDQVMTFILKEHERGTSQAQIAIKLQQKGVKFDQIRRVRDKALRMQKGEGLGTIDVNKENGDSRLRNNQTVKQKQQQYNEEQNEADQYSTNRINASRRRNKNTNNYSETDVETQQYLDQLDDIVPMDTTRLVKKLLKEREEARYNKKVFGRDIFNNEELSFEPNMNIATPTNYRLGPGDAVFIDVYGASSKSVESTVSPDGYVNIEGFGPVQVSGLTVGEANAKLRSQLGARYRNSNIKLTVGQTRTIMVNVMGEVKAPGTYTLSAFASVFHALYMAGGVSELGTLRNIKVFRNNRLVTVVDIYDYLLNGKLSGNVRLADNDIIVVGPYDCLVNISGKVKRPMFYEMKKNESINTLLKYSGGFTGDAYKKTVRVTRKTGKEYSIYNVNEFDFGTFHVNDEDSVSIDSIIPRYENRVQIKGAVFRPGMYQVGGDITTVKSLIEHADGIKEEAFTTHAVMHRMRSDRTLEVIPVDVDGIMNGTVADIPLQKEDVLFIPTKKEMMQEQTITIHGEVQYPGVYKYAANETLEDFVLQAGGLTEKASTAKVDVARRVSDPKATKVDSLIARTYSFSLKDGFVIDGTPGFTLLPFDEVYVRQSPGYSKQQNVSVEGEVTFEGTYTLQHKSTRLSDIIKMAGGPSDRAYIRGAKLERKTNDVERTRMEAALLKEREQQQKNLIETMAKSANAGAVSQMANQAKDAEMQKFNVPDYYPVAIELDKALANPGSEADLVMREGDRIIVPQYNATVKVNGAVMYPNSMGYQDGKSVRFYINQAGGFSSDAKKSQTYIIYMNGSIAKATNGTKPEPGCEIVVPSKVKNSTSIAETMTIGTGIASIATMIATIASLLK